MEFLESIFGAQGSKIVWWLIAFVIVLVLAVVVLRGLRALMGTRLNMSERGAGRGRAPRLGVTEFFNLDRQGRRLVIVRRDNVEHLVLIGGPNDVLIESSIQRGERNVAPRVESRESARFDDMTAPLPESIPPARPLPTHEHAPVSAAVEPHFEPPAAPEPRMPAPPPVNDRTPVGDVPRDHLAQRLDEVLRKPLPPRPSEPPAKPSFEDMLRAKEPPAVAHAAEVKAPEAQAHDVKAPETPAAAKPSPRLPDLLADALKPRSLATPTMPQPAPSTHAAQAPSAPPPPAPKPEPAKEPAQSMTPAHTATPARTMMPAPTAVRASTAPVHPAPVHSAPAKPATAPAATSAASDTPGAKNPFDSLEEEMAKLLGRGLGDKL
jgi:hypothetical protein